MVKSKRVGIRNIHGLVYDTEVSNVDNLLARGWTLTKKGDTFGKSNNNEKRVRTNFQYRRIRCG